MTEEGHTSVYKELVYGGGRRLEREGGGMQLRIDRQRSILVDNTDSPLINLHHVTSTFQK